MKKISHILSCIVLFLLFDIHSQTTNIDFELTPPGAYTTSNAVSGWTISSQTNTTGTCNTVTVWVPGSPEFSIVTTPILSVPFIGTLPNSPLGGTTVARLNNTTVNGSVTKLSQTFSVSTVNALFQFAYAGIWQDGGHSCCAQAGFKFKLYDYLGNQITCPSYSLAGVGCPIVSSYTLSSTTAWTNWQVVYIDLTPYVGSSITVEARANDCTFGDHYATIFFDAQSGGQICCGIYPLNNSPTDNGISFCAGSSLANVNAPIGYAQYFWTAPLAYPISTSQATLSSLSLTNAVVGSIYTLTSSGGNCFFVNTYTLVSTTVSIAGIGTSSSCAGGASGSATVVAAGSGSGYNYLWTNSSNLTVGTNSVLNNLASGIYTVNISASGTQSATCGNSSTSVTVNIAPTSVNTFLKPFCGNEAYLYYPNGTNYQWYNNLTPITASLGGTAPGYTVTSAFGGDIYRLGYTSQYGCNDSLSITLISVFPGSVSVTSSIICPGATNGIASISLIPAPGAPNGINSYSVFSTGITPPYNATLNPTSSNFFMASGLSAGGTYSVKVFDGACKYNTSFSVIPYNVNFTLSPQSSTVCSGNSVFASVAFSSSVSVSQYNYSWSPALFLWQTGNTSFNLITPTTTPGSVSTTIYTIVVTPTLINCPFTKTLSVTSANLFAPVITPIPALCSSVNNYSIATNPIGGTFYNGANSGIGAYSGILTPSLVAVGINSFTYAISVGSCVAQSSATYAIMGVNLTANSKTSIICGQTATLSASGADTYLWSNASTNSSIIITPTNTSTYYVTGTNYTSTCSKTSTINVTVTSTLALSIIGNFSFCNGNSTTLNVNGANTYLWNNTLTLPPIILSPTVTNSYSLTGIASNGCQTNSQVVVTVHPLPAINIAGNTSICPGRYTVLTAYGGNVYVWNTGATIPIITLTPSITTDYWVTGTDQYGCINSATLAVVVEECVGLKDYAKDESEINIYPNPTNGKLIIETKNEIHISLHNQLGQILLEENIQPGNYNLDLSAYNAGLYFLTVTTERSAKIIKLVRID